MDGNFIVPSDFKMIELEGTTHATANTSSKFRHGKGQVPWAWLILEGNVYVPKDGAGPKEIDVRSSNSSEKFRMLLLF